jgi:hypothetical protein
MLDREDGGEVIERGLADAVPAPALVRLDRGVRTDVQDPAAGGPEGREDRLGEGQRGDRVDDQDPLEFRG